MAEATLTKDANANTVDETAAAAIASGEVYQLTDGRAGVKAGLLAAASGDPVSFITAGQFPITKSADLVILKGGKVFWDRAANAATPLQAAAGADFYVGAALEDAAAAATTVSVDLNVKPTYTIDMKRDPGLSVPVLTAGTPYLFNRGAGLVAGFSATAEAQKEDWLSVHSVPVTIPMILEAIFAVNVTCDADVGDLNIGLANATHASDGDSITESCFFHADLGADLNLDAESDDGTTEVAATDTTVDLVAFTPVEVWIDARDLTDIQLYVNGVNVLPDSVFALGDATGPLKALFHLEKSANDSLGEVQVSHLAVRAMDLAS